MKEKPPRLEPESLKALADKVTGGAVVPKKVPAATNIDAQIAAVGGALSSALLTATEVPLTVLQPVIADLAKQLVALGIRQTKHVDPDAVHAPTWITDGMRQQSMKVPEQPRHTEAEPPQQRIAEAPKPPKQLPAAARAVRR